MSQGAPAVSVVIPAFNRARLIRGVVDSVLAQTVTDLQIVVVDDASTDSTADVVAEIDDPRVRLVRHAVNSGGNAARTTGIEHSTGRHVAFLDSDDTWHPEKLQRQLTLLRARGPGYGLCTTWFSMTTPAGRVVHRVEPRLDGHRLPDLLVANWLGGYSSVVVERALLQQVGGPDCSLPACQDWDLYLRLNQVTGVCVVPEHLVEYRFDPADPVRISTRRAAVIAGHRHIYRHVLPRLAAVGDEHAVASRRTFLEVFANAGALAEVATVIRQTPARLWSPGLMRFAGHMLARAARKQAVLGERTRE